MAHPALVGVLVLVAAAAVIFLSKKHGLAVVAGSGPVPAVLPDDNKRPGK